jgi:hypothetical protein
VLCSAAAAAAVQCRLVRLPVLNPALVHLTPIMSPSHTHGQVSDPPDGPAYSLHLKQLQRVLMTVEPAK